MSVDKYQAAGVSIDAGNRAAVRYKAHAKTTSRPGVLGGLGGFAGGFEIDLARYPKPVLLSGTDGVGTKLKVAFATGRHDTIGIDCVAMCVNDVLTSGAEPLVFLDYLAVGRLDVDVAEEIVKGIAEGCSQAGCALVGGETAEMPGMYENGEYDVAGFTVGVANKDEIIDGSTIASGDVVIGLLSNGIHSNGYSLVRKLIEEANLGWNDDVPGFRGTVADELLRPTRIYVKPILALLESGVKVKGMAHITGGGIVENLPRCLPTGVGVQLDAAAWPVPQVLTWLQHQAEMTFVEAARVWNMGIGYAVIVAQEDSEEVVKFLTEQGETPYIIGRVVPGDNTVGWVGA